jgi:hypothetical protein
MLTNPFRRLFRELRTAKAVKDINMLLWSAVSILLDHLSPWPNFSKEKLEKGTDR